MVTSYGPGGVPNSKIMESTEAQREGLSRLPVLQKEHQAEAPSPHPLTSAAKQSTSLPPYLIETRWTAVRQVQARAVRQECAEGVEEVERGGRKEGWELIAAREQEGTDKSFLFCLPTIYLVGEVGEWVMVGHSWEE